MGQEASSHHIKFLNSIFKRLRETPANDEGQRKSWYSVYSPCRKAGCVLLTDILDLHCIGSSLLSATLPVSWAGLPLTFRDIRKVLSRLKD